MHAHVQVGGKKGSNAKRKGKDKDKGESSKEPKRGVRKTQLLHK